MDKFNEKWGPELTTLEDILCVYLSFLFVILVEAHSCCSEGFERVEDRRREICLQEV